jgi:hypothetical protein
MSTSSFPWRFIFLSLLVAVSGYIAYDVNTKGSLRGSETGKFLKNAGLLETTESAIVHAKVYYKKAYSWSETNIPYYVNTTATYAGPYLQQFWSISYEYSVIAWNYTQPLRDYLDREVPKLLQWINNNLPQALRKVNDRVMLYGEKLLVLTGEYAIIVWNLLVRYVLLAGTWLQENVFTGQMSTDKIQAATWKAVESVQQYSVSAFDWVQRQMAGGTVGSATGTATPTGAKH